jgi:decaprenylphospho-beta-D-ribofuranose 2-oxidase
MRLEWIKGWGNPNKELALAGRAGLARGNGQSYGDSALHTHVLKLQNNKGFYLNETTGVLVAQSGATLGEILAYLIPLGWTLPVVPGSSLVTIGGAVASDVHGKNHRSQGCFSEHLESLKIMIDDETLLVLPGSPLFQATCGGMGLTGVILEVRIKLMKMTQAGWIKRNACFERLEDLFQKLVDTKAPLVNGWVDSSRLSRGVISEVSQTEMAASRFTLPPAPIPWSFDVWSSQSQNLFNTLYFNAQKLHSGPRRVMLQDELFPLEKRLAWNNLCGDKGIVQLHFVVPEADNILQILHAISREKFRPLLISLKKFGPRNDQLLSFPMDGFGAAIDFKQTPEARNLVAWLIESIIQMKGRVYLTKDSLMTQKQFKRMYPEWEEFQQIRSLYGSLGKFSSRQSKRLGLD